MAVGIFRGEHKPLAGFCSLFRIFDDVEVIGIDHGCLAVGIPALEGAAVVSVDVAVEEVFWLVCFHKRAKGLETPVGKVLHVIDLGGRSVSYQDVKALMLSQLPEQLSDAPAHLPLRVLVFRSRNVLHGASQAQDAHPFVYVDVVLDADAALRGALPVSAVVVAPDIEQGNRAEGGEKGQIFRFQVAAGNDQVNVL